MPEKRQSPDAKEIKQIARMARESRDFYKGLAQALRPQESSSPAGTEKPQGSKGQESGDQQNDGSPA